MKRQYLCLLRAFFNRTNVDWWLSNGVALRTNQIDVAETSVGDFRKIRKHYIFVTSNQFPFANKNPFCITTFAHILKSPNFSPFHKLCWKQSIVASNIWQQCGKQWNQPRPLRVDRIRAWPPPIARTSRQALGRIVDMTCSDVASTTIAELPSCSNKTVTWPQICYTCRNWYCPHRQETGTA